MGELGKDKKHLNLKRSILGTQWLTVPVEENSLAVGISRQLPQKYYLLHQINISN